MLCDLDKLIELVPSATIIPVDGATKRPMVAWKDWPAGKRMVSPEGHGAILTGSRSGVFVVDCDSKEAIEYFVEHFKPPSSMSVRTRRGIHFYFLLPDGFEVKCSHNELGPGIDVKGEGGYVLGPGCPDKTLLYRHAPVHATFDHPALHRPDASRWAEPAQQPSQENAYLAVNYARNAPLPEGDTRELTMLRVAGQMKAWVDEETAVSILNDIYNPRCLDDNGNPWPWSIAELRHKYQDAQVPEEWRVPIVEAPQKIIRPRVQIIEESDDGLQALDMTTPPPPEQWCIEGIFQTDSVNFVAGAPGSLKSWTIYSMALSITSGNPWLGRCRVCKPGNVLLLDWEAGQRRVLTRLQKLCNNRQPQNQILYASNWGKLHMDDDFWERLAESCVRRDIVAVFYDSLSGGSGPVDEASPIFAQAVKDAGYIDEVMHVFVHHGTKNGESSMRGTNAIEAACDSIYKLSTPTGELPGDLRCEMRQERVDGLGTLKKIPLILTGEGKLSWDETPGTTVVSRDKQEDIDARVLMAVQNAPEGISRESLRRNVCCGIPTMNNSLNLHRDEGRIFKQGRRWFPIRPDLP